MKGRIKRAFILKSENSLSFTQYQLEFLKNVPTFNTLAVARDLQSTL